MITRKIKDVKPEFLKETFKNVLGSKGIYPSDEQLEEIVKRVVEIGIQKEKDGKRFTDEDLYSISALIINIKAEKAKS